MLVESIHRITRVVPQGDEILSREKDVKFIGEIALGLGIVFWKMEHHKNIVVIGVDSRRLIWLDDCITVKLVKSILLDNSINYLITGIDDIYPFGFVKSDRPLGHCHW